MLHDISQYCPIWWNLFQLFVSDHYSTADTVSQDPPRYISRRAIKLMDMHGIVAYCLGYVIYIDLCISVCPEIGYSETLRACRVPTYKAEYPSSSQSLLQQLRRDSLNWTWIPPRVQILGSEWPGFRWDAQRWDTEMAPFNPHTFIPNKLRFMGTKHDLARSCMGVVPCCILWWLDLAMI